MARNQCVLHVPMGMNEKYMSASGLHNALQYHSTRAAIANI